MLVVYNHCLVERPRQYMPGRCKGGSYRRILVLQILDCNYNGGINTKLRPRLLSPAIQSFKNGE